MIASVLEGMAIQSFIQVTPAYYDIALTRKYARDDASAEMLDIALAYRVYDIGLICDFGGIRHPMDTDEEYEVASTIAALADKAQSDMDALLATIAALP